MSRSRGTRAKDEPRLYCWMLHDQRLLDLVDDDRLPFVRALTRFSLHRSWLDTRTRELDRWLRTHDVPSLEVLIAQDRPVTGRLVWLEAPFAWSTVAAERRRLDTDPDVRSSFHAELPAGEGTITVKGTFSPRHLTCSSANSELAGVRTQYMLATVAAQTADCIELRPLAIAERFMTPCFATGASSEWQTVSPRQIDQFAHVDFDAPVSRSDLEALRDVPEAEVKAVFAQLLGEPVIPKDWGGEQMDLWTTRLLVDGVQLSAAFLLKGPAKFAPMTVAMLGKNGDQLERLARTAADILVLQHCHEITPPVVSTLRAHASDYRNPRRYLIIDGYDTLRILRTTGRWKQ